jgi:deoxyribodipyrimidine photo-lyase
MTTNRFIVWFRNDLRIHDNEVISKIANYAASKEVLPIYCFDPRVVSTDTLRRCLTQFSPPFSSKGLAESPTVKRQAAIEPSSLSSLSMT